MILLCYIFVVYVFYLITLIYIKVIFVNKQAHKIHENLDPQKLLTIW